MKNRYISSLLIFVGLIANQAMSATPPPSHKELSKHLENGIEWAKHLRGMT